MEKAQVLIVEDDGIIAMDLESRLKSFGYSVPGIVSYGEDAIKKVEECRPDLVFMDIVLKGEIDGIEAADQIRTQFNIPVVFVTAHMDEDRLERAKLTLPFGYVLKPFQDRELKATIEMALYTSKVDTERKQAEEALRESEGKYRTVLDNIEDGYYEVDIAGNLTFFNDSLCKIYGYSRNELTGMGYKQYTDKENGKKVFKLFNSVYRTGEPAKAFDWVFVKKDKTIINVETSVSLMKDDDGNPIGFRGIVRDITERKQAEEALRESKERFKLLADATIEGLAFHEKGLLLDANDRFVEMFGYDSLTEMLDMKINVTQLASPKTREIVRKNATERYPEPYEAEGLRKDGSIFPIIIRGRQIPHEGRMVRIAAVRDITEQEKAEQERTRLATAIEQAAESVIISDRPGMIQYVNPAFERLSGYTKEEIIGQNFRILKSDKHDEAFYRKMFDSISRGKIWSGRIINRMKDGTLREFETRISPVRDSSGEIINFVSVNRDVTQEVALEAQLQQSQKIQSIGTLAGGIAHDFNNILYPIIGYTEMAIDDVPEDSLTRKNLEEVLKATKRARDLVKQILTFSRQSDRELKPLKFQSIVKEATKLMRASIPSTITISQNINNDCGAIKGDQTQIHQIAMNLCTNAYQSMEETGGKLELCLDEIAIGPDEAIDKVGMKPGRYARLTVSDTGHGMEPAVMEKIFDPYFTTKEVGKGTGLGLSVVHGIVNTHGGHISASSEPGKGTKFDVYLPLFESAEIEAETVSIETLATGDEHILLVDDENQIVDVVRQMLERLGYQVTVRTSSIEALEAFRASPDKFDLVITDLTMPNMEGDKLSGELMNIRTDIPIILCTGFSEKMSEERANALGIKGFLMKPVITNALAKTVREVLDKS